MVESPYNNYMQGQRIVFIELCDHGLYLIQRVDNSDQIVIPSVDKASKNRSVEEKIKINFVCLLES